MRREVIWTWSAEADLQEAYRHGEDSTEGFGGRLVATIDHLLDLLRQFPEMAGMWHPPVRRALIRRTRYGLFYVVESNRLVVVAMQNLRQSPERILQELRRRLP